MTFCLLFFFIMLFFFLPIFLCTGGLNERRTLQLHREASEELLIVAKPPDIEAIYSTLRGGMLSDALSPLYTALLYTPTTNVTILYYTHSLCIYIHFFLFSSRIIIEYHVPIIFFLFFFRS